MATVNTRGQVKCSMPQRKPITYWTILMTTIANVNSKTPGPQHWLRAFGIASYLTNHKLIVTNMSPNNQNIPFPIAEVRSLKILSLGCCVSGSSGKKHQFPVCHVSGKQLCCNISLLSRRWLNIWNNRDSSRLVDIKMIKGRETEDQIKKHSYLSHKCYMEWKSRQEKWNLNDVPGAILSKVASKSLSEETE